MGKKNQEGITRREAMTRIMQIVALAAGISVSDLTFLLSAADAQTLTKLKILKVKLSGFDRQVFESEFGHVTPLVPIKTVPGQIMEPGQIIGDLKGCSVFFALSALGAAACPSLANCGSNSSGCPCLDSCNENVCSGQDYGGGGCWELDCTGTNDCNGQDCPNLTSCGDNECTDQDCPKLTNCEKHKSSLLDTLNQFRTDQYIQDLMRYFNVTTTQALATQINTMIQQHKTITPIQLQQEILQNPLLDVPK